MKIQPMLSDEAVLQELGARLSHRRKLVQLTQAELAREAGVSRSTVERLEAGHSVQFTNLIRVLRQLGLLANLEALLPPAEPSPMELLKRGKPRRRVRKPKDAGEEWTWATDESDR